jgi:hypothetical protein
MAIDAGFAASISGKWHGRTLRDELFTITANL